MRNIGMVMGVSISGALFSALLNKENSLYTSQGLSGAAMQQAAFTYALHYTFIAAGIIALLAMAASSAKGKNKIKPVVYLFI